jgi:hypothetical protein
MPYNSKSQKEFENADDIVIINQRLLVHDAILEGKSLAKLSKETGISEWVLKARKKEVTATLTQAFHDEVEFARAQATAISSCPSRSSRCRTGCT